MKCIWMNLKSCFCQKTLRSQSLGTTKNKQRLDLKILTFLVSKPHKATGEGNTVCYMAAAQKVKLVKHNAVLTTSHLNMACKENLANFC